MIDSSIIYRQMFWFLRVIWVFPEQKQWLKVKICSNWRTCSSSHTHTVENKQTYIHIGVPIVHSEYIGISIGIYRLYYIDIGVYIDLYCIEIYGYCIGVPMELRGALLCPIWLGEEMWDGGWMWEVEPTTWSGKRERQWYLRSAVLHCSSLSLADVHQEQSPALGQGSQFKPLEFLFFQFIF